MTNELQLWAAFQRGSVDAYTALYNGFTSQLYSYGMKFTADKAIVEDAIHDLFCNLWTGRERLTQPSFVKNYLFKSLRNILLRKINKKDLVLDNEGKELDFHFELAIDEKLCQNEQIFQIQKEVQQALEKLTSRQREIIYYRFYQNLSFEEIADIMDMQIRATYKLTSRALDNLRQYIHSSNIILLLLLFKVR